MSDFINLFLPAFASGFSHGVYGYPVFQQSPGTMREFELNVIAFFPTDKDKRNADDADWADFRGLFTNFISIMIIQQDITLKKQNYTCIKTL